MRLFTAIDIPDEVRAALARLIARLKPLARIRWSAAENLHVTIKFIGEWPDARVAEVHAALRTVGSQPIDIAIGGVGWFPDDRHPRVLFVTVEAGPELAALAASTDRALVSLGASAEPRAFRPHLTLARLRERLPLEALRTGIEQLAAAPFGSFTATVQHLYVSRGGKYSKLGSFSFA